MNTNVNFVINECVLFEIKYMVITVILCFSSTNQTKHTAKCRFFLFYFYVTSEEINGEFSKEKRTNNNINFTYKKLTKVTVIKLV